MRYVIVLEYDFEFEDEYTEAVAAARDLLPAGTPVRVATADSADRILESFVIEGQEPKR